MQPIKIEDCSIKRMLEKLPDSAPEEMKEAQAEWRQMRIALVLAQVSEAKAKEKFLKFSDVQKQARPGGVLDRVRKLFSNEEAGNE